MEKKSKIKEISMMVYRKYTEDFDSLGYRLGITLEVKDGDARDAWYQGRLFLGERITEEELLIDKKFEWLAKKKKGFPDVKVETDVIKVKSKPEGMNLVEIPQENENLYDIKKLPQYKGEISEENAEYLEDVLKNVVSDVIKAEGRISIDVKQIITTSLKAVLVKLFDNRDVWIPKSCIRGGDKVDNWEKNVKTMLFVDKWFLEKEGILSKY